MSQGPRTLVPESPPSGPAAAAASEPVPPPEPEPEPELELPPVDALPLEELEPPPDEDALEDPPSDSPGCEALLPFVEHAKAVHAKLRAAARWTLPFIESAPPRGSSNLLVVQVEGFVAFVERHRFRSLTHGERDTACSRKSAQGGEGIVAVGPSGTSMPSPRNCWSIRP